MTAEEHGAAAGPRIGTPGCSHDRRWTERLLEKANRIRTEAWCLPNHHNAEKHVGNQTQIEDCCWLDKQTAACLSAENTTPGLLTKQMLYVSYKLNFTPGFLLIRGSSEGCCPPNQHGKRTQRRRPQSLTRCRGDVEKRDERARA